MRVISILSLLLFAVGAALLYQGMKLEGSQAYLVFIFPVLVLSGPMSFLGALLVFLALISGVLSLGSGFMRNLFGPATPPRGQEMPKEPAVREGVRTRWGGILLLGPIPVIFGSDVKVTTALLVLAVALTVALIILFI